MLQVPDCVSFGELGSRNVMAMSDVAGEVDTEPGEPFLPSGVHLDMPVGVREWDGDVRIRQ